MDIYKDRWIPELSVGKVTARRLEGRNPTVNKFFNQQRDWDLTELNNTFRPYEVDAITKVHLHETDREDKRYWCF